MFEFQIRHKRFSSDHLPREVRVLFKDFSADINAICLLPWEEHCTECAMPQCFLTCDLYQMRSDGKCRRFIDGISPIPDVPNVQGYVVRVAFKRWAKLMARSQVNMVPVRRARVVERIFRHIDTFVARVPDDNISLLGRRSLFSRLMRRMKQYVTRNGTFADHRLADPDYFLIDIYNPMSTTIGVSLLIRNWNNEQRKIPFQQLLSLETGYNRFKIPYYDISKLVDTKDDIEITLNPNIVNKEEEGLILYFGTITFVSDGKYRTTITNSAEEPDTTVPGPIRTTCKAQKTKQMVKVVAWDLDNTIWDGILVEDGHQMLALKAMAKEIIIELDRRGIINTVVSKNDPEQALEQLRRFGLEEYMVFPKISWSPKGDSIHELIKEFSIAPDAMAFIDDSPFEREQVCATNPDVRIYDSNNYCMLLEREELNPAVTEEGSKRREYYRTQKRRGVALVSFSGEYSEFLTSCEIKLYIDIANNTNLERVHELIQRTNQLNLSGNRYSREQISQLLEDERYDKYAMACVDKFGEYGVVGFCLVENSKPRVIDLVFSCRIQGKRVEHAFLNFLLERTKARGFDTLEGEFRMTNRNKAAGMVYQDLGFKEIDVREGVHLYAVELRRMMPSDQIIQVYWQGQEWTR